MLSPEFVATFLGTRHVLLDTLPKVASFANEYSNFAGVGSGLQQSLLFVDGWPPTTAPSLVQPCQHMLGKRQVGSV